MIQKLWLPFRFPSLNEYINADRSGKYAGATMKKKWTNNVKLLAQTSLEPQRGPVAVSMAFSEPNARRDPDAHCFALKAAADGLVAAGILPDDSPKYIKAINLTWGVVQSDKVGVLLVITDVVE